MQRGGGEGLMGAGRMGEGHRPGGVGITSGQYAAFNNRE